MYGQRHLHHFISLLALLSLCTAAHAKPTTFKNERSYSYDIRIGSLTLGQAKVAIEQKRGKKRRIRVQAKINLLGGGSMGVSTRSTTWVDNSWKPVRSKWNWEIFGKKRRVDAKFGARKYDGRFYTGTRLKKRMQGKTPKRTQRINDLISVVPWLMSQPMRPGRILRTRAYTGMQLYRISAKVGQKEQMVVMGENRTVYPIHVTAVRRGKTRRITLWLDAKNRTPYKASFDLDFASEISLVLTQQNKSRLARPFPAYRIDLKKFHLN